MAQKIESDLEQRKADVAARLAELDRDYDRYMEDFLMPPVQPVQELPPVLSLDQAYLFELSVNIRRLSWLNEGPDGYDTIDDTISPTQESRYSYDPKLLWSFNLFNNAASGGANLLFRLTDSYGRIKQYKQLPQTAFSLKDIRGTMGSVLNVVTDTGPAEMIGWIGYKDKFKVR